MSMTLPIWICRAICTSTCWAKLATAGQNGQFRTPKHIREMMVELLQPTSDDTICDPACGTAGFLVSAAEYIRNHYEDTKTFEQWEHFAGDAFTGFDTDRAMLRISAMNLMLPPSATRRSTTRTVFPSRIRSAISLPCVWQIRLSRAPWTRKASTTT